MNRRHHCVLACGLLLAASVPCGLAATVQPAAPTPAAAGKAAEVSKDANAALRYWAAFSQVSKELADKVREIDFDKLTTKDAVAAAMKEAGLETGCPAATGMLFEATKLTRCDFEVNWDEGPMALLPHLAQLRTSSRLLRLEARRLQMEGTPDEAARHCAAIVRLAGHASNDRCLISSLVGIAICELGFAEIKQLLATGKVSAAAAAELRSAVEGVDAADPMRMAEALRNEGKVFADWLEKQLNAPGGMNKVKEIQGVSTGDPAIDKQVSAMDAAAMRADLPKLRAAYAKLESAWAAADAGASIGQVERDASSGKFGLLAQVWLPAINKASESRKRFLSRRGEVLEQLKAVK
jgi:hypothetical protein